MTIELTPEHQRIAEEARRRIQEGLATLAMYPPEVVEHTIPQDSDDES
jgi:hypothetical protein